MRPSASGRRPDDSRSRAPSRSGSWVCSPSAGPLGMHIFVPALPAAAKDLHATPAALELTISLYILGLAVGQLVYGPASDRFGRRPTLLVGLSIFTIASIAGLFAPDTHTLILARFFQAVGGCSGLVLARAIIRDTSQAHEAARRLALTNLLVTAGPAVAPLIGGALSSLWGWRTILDGAERHRRRQFRPGVAHPAGDPSGGGSVVSASRYARDYFGLLRSRQFLGYAIGGGLRDDLALRVHRLRAVHLRRSAACAKRERGPLSGAACFRALARQPSRKPVDRALFPYAIRGRRQRRQRRGGRFAPRPRARRPGDPGWDRRNDVRVQRRGRRCGARRPCQGHQREPARHSERLLDFTVRSRWLSAPVWSRSLAWAPIPRWRPPLCSSAQASWRRRLSGSREMGARRWSSRRATARPKAA